MCIILIEKPSHKEIIVCMYTGEYIVWRVRGTVSPFELACDVIAEGSMIDRYIGEHVWREERLIA